jgi:hypothetical protein
MSEPPDVERIKQPTHVPPDQPDPKTQAEAQDLTRRKALTPLEREAATFRLFIDSLNVQIGDCKVELVRAQAETASLRSQLESEKRRGEALAVRCARLEEVGSSVGFMTVLGTIMTVVGGVLLSIAGAAPNLTDASKTGLVVGGTVGAACGVFLVLAGAFRWWRSRPTLT